MNPKLLAEALDRYKGRYGYKKNRDIDLDKLNEIAKEIEDERKAATGKSTRRNRRGN